MSSPQVVPGDSRIRDALHEIACALANGYLTIREAERAEDRLLEDPDEVAAPPMEVLDLPRDRAAVAPKCAGSVRGCAA